MGGGEGGTEPSPAQEYGLLLAVFFRSLSGATVDLMASRIGPKWSTSNSNVAIGPIRGRNGQRYRKNENA